MLTEDYAKSVIFSILKEEANQADVIDAIRKKYEVNITYNDGANGPRRIQPCAYGKTSKGNLVLRAYQPEGSSNTTSHGWKYFLLDRINGWEPQKDVHFSEPPEFRGDGEYNSNGDKSMSEVYLVADFGDSEGGELETNTGNVETERPDPPTSNMGNNISGMGETRPQVNPYSSSSKEMSVANNFGDTNASQTVGPVTKDNMETTQDNSSLNTTQKDYDNVEQNAPLYKTDIQEPEDNNIENLQFADDNEEENNF